MKRTSLLPAAFAALINATVWGVSWFPLHWLEAHGVPALWTTLLIFAACTMLIWVVRPGAWRHLVTSPQLIWVCLASGLTNVCFNLALATGDVVRSVLLFYLMPMWVVLLARWLLQEAITAMAIARLLLALAGAILVLGQGSSFVPVPESLADWLAVVAGFSFGLNNVLLRRYANLPDDARGLAMFSGAVLCAPLVIGWMLAQGQPVALNPEPVAWIGLLLFTVAVLIGNLALQFGATRLRANVLSVLMLAEILVASVSSWLAGVATITGATLAGGMFIIGASLLAISTPTSAQVPTH